MKPFLLLLIFLLPFQFALNPTPGIDLSVVRLAIVLAFFVWLCAGFLKKDLKIPNNPISWLLGLFLAFALLSIISAENINWAIRKLLVFLSIFPLYFLVSTCFEKTDFLKISCTIAWTSTLTAILGILQFLSQFAWGSRAVFNFWSHHLAKLFLVRAFSQAVIDYPSWWVNISGKTYLRATAFFPDPHMLAFFLGMSLPFSLFLALRQQKNKPLRHYIFYGTAVIINLTALILTFSRGGYLGLLATGFTLLLLGWRYLHKKQKIILAAILPLLLFALVFIPAVSARLFSSFNLQEGSVAGRLTIWQNAFDVWRQHFWAGVGLGNYSYYLNPLHAYRLPVYAHNTYLDIAVEMGIFALLAWLSIFLYVILKLLAQRKLYRKDYNLQLFAWAIIGSLAYFLAHCFFDTPLYSPRILPYFMVLLGLTSLLIKKNSSKKS